MDEKVFFLTKHPVQSHKNWHFKNPSESAKTVKNTSNKKNFNNFEKLQSCYIDIEQGFTRFTFSAAISKPD